MMDSSTSVEVPTACDNPGLLGRGQLSAVHGVTGRLQHPYNIATDMLEAFHQFVTFLRAFFMTVMTH